MSDLVQNHMSTSHTIRAHAQEVWDKSDKDEGWLPVGKRSGNPQLQVWFASSQVAHPCVLLSVYYLTVLKEHYLYMIVKKSMIFSKI